jgi:putative SOS response-associated peptidase YedK
MCGRFNQHDVLKRNQNFEKKLSRWSKQKKANITPGMLAMVITEHDIVEAEFGFRPKWDEKKLFINARIEGSRENPENLNDGWVIGLDKTMSFKDAFTNNRCIIPVNSFIEGPEKEKLSKPFLIKPRNDDELLYLAGIHTEYTNNQGITENCFAIVTTPPHPTCKEIGHHRTPLIISEINIPGWLNNAAQNYKEVALKDSKNLCELEAYPLDPLLVKSGKLHDEYILTNYQNQKLF